MPIVVTNCTSRKRSTGYTGPSTTDLRTGNLIEVANEWREKLNATNPKQEANAVYCGRSFREVEIAAKSLNAELFIISAGLGVIHSKTKIPCYNLTVSCGTPVSVNNKIIPPYSSKNWWLEVTKNNPYGTPLQNLLANHPNELILFALPKAYIDLIFCELDCLPVSHRENLRFFGKNTKAALPSILQNNWMPYDDRLQALGKGYSGTQSDFAQRALKHFVHYILPDSLQGNALIHSNNILNHFKLIDSAKKVERKKIDDSTIEDLMRAHSINGTLTATGLLRIFRHSLGIACEQTRFKKIYQSVQNEYKR